MSRMLFLVLVLFASAPAFADSRLETLFQQDFYTQYKEGKCGANVLNFVTHADREGLDMRRAHVLELKNRGFSVLGMLNAEYARGQGPLYTFDDPKGLQGRKVGETNWEFHAILELDGLIYDFDFGNTPKVLPVAEYFERMFFQEKTLKEGGNFFVGREDRLKDYEITILSAEEYLQQVKQPAEQKMRLGEFLRMFR